MESIAIYGEKKEEEEEENSVNYLH